MQWQPHALVIGALVASSCVPSSPGNVSPTPPPYKPKDQSLCAITKSSSKPLIVEWPAAERARLESLTRQGIVAVRYQGCDMEVLPNCHLDGSYSYTATTRQQDHTHITDADDLYAKLPVGAASLEGKLRQAGELNVSMIIVGAYDASKKSVVRSDLQGDCHRATHVITGLTAGAFRFYAGADAQAGAGASILGVGAGAGTSASKHTINEAGSAEACNAATTRDVAPPEGCGALLRVEVTPISAAAPLPTPVASASASAPDPASSTSPPPPLASASPPTDPQPMPCLPGEVRRAGACVSLTSTTYGQPTSESLPPNAPRTPEDAKVMTYVISGTLLVGIVVGIVFLAKKKNESSSTEPAVGGLGKSYVNHPALVQW